MPTDTERPPYALTLLGDMRLRGPHGDVDRVLVNAKAVALLAYLALPSIGRFVRRDSLAAMLWPELDQSRARTAVRKTVHALRQAIDADVLISRGDEDVALSATVLWCDATAFITATEESRLLQALSLYRDELMPGFHLPDCAEFGRWLDDQRRDARELAAAASWALAQRLESDNRLSDAISMARRSTRFDWSDERAMRRAALMLERLGDRAGALRMLDEFARRLRTELDAEPSRETRDLERRLRAGAPA